MEDRSGPDGLSEMLQRTTLCVSGSQPGVAAHSGDLDFRETIRKHYKIAENNATEKVIRLKARLRDASLFDFWHILMQGMTEMTGAQYGFVAKRMEVDEEEPTVQLPKQGEPDSCLMAVAYYYNDGKDMRNLHRDYKYVAYGSPCEHMKHDKVFLIPNEFPRFINNNPNTFPFPPEAYLGVPLFARGECFGHLGLMWNKSGVENLNLSWAFIELLMHSLEDMIHNRLLENHAMARAVEKPPSRKISVVDPSTTPQSFRPYARSLSHELRTPMHGVVGMLDMMYATVQESLEGQNDQVVRKVLRTLRENIEVVQDSSQRAVEAADNVVLAYDLNMSVPDTPVAANDDESSIDAASNMSPHRQQSTIFPDNRRGSYFNRGKRPRASDSMDAGLGPAAKQRQLRSSRSRTVSPHTVSLKSAVVESDSLTGQMEGVLHESASKSLAEITKREEHVEPPEPEEAVVTPGLRHTKVRELLHLVINESLRVGGRPESAVAEEIDGGEVIEVRTRSADGELRIKTIEWTVDPQIPELILVDERDFAKLISCVFLNAVKFTEEGRITLTAKLSSKARFVVIKVSDTGPGIPEAFQPYLFRPFSREDDSLTRQKEGLGLGLLVAKGLARKIGGEITCTRSTVDGPMHGSEFELRVPLHAADPTSRAGTPSRTPSPGFRGMDEPPSPFRTRNNSSTDHHLSPHDYINLQGPGTPEPLPPTSSPRQNSLATPQQMQPFPPPPTLRRPSTKANPTADRHLAKKHPLSFLVAEDNAINRKILVNMLRKLGYTHVHEAHDGLEAVNQMNIDRPARGEPPIDVVLMDLWMPNMDGYQATEQILRSKSSSSKSSLSSSSSQKPDKKNQSLPDEDMPPPPEENGDDETECDGNRTSSRRKPPTVLAVTADVTNGALERASQVGMEGFMGKPYKILDLERLILQHCVDNSGATTTAVA